MSQRRGDYEGTVRQRGDTWQGRVMLDGHVYAVTGGTRKEAIQKLQALSAKHYDGTLGKPGPTVGQWLATWQERSKREWKTTTAERYADIIRIHLQPPLGKLGLSSLTPAQIQACMTGMAVTGATRLKVYRVLHRALNVAMYDGLIPSNPCAAVEAPRIRRSSPTLWTSKELKTFVDSWEPAAPGYLLWPLLIGSGCRLGEALALRWANYQGGWVTIASTLSESKAGLEITSPKTDSAYRRLLLPVAMRAVLDKQIGAPSAPIVVTKTGQSPARRLAARWLLTQCEKAEVPPIRIHDLRHLHASILIREGVPVTEVANRLGHASPAITTSVYSHLIRGSGEASVRAMDNALGG